MKYAAVIFDLFGTVVEIYSRRDYEKVVALMAAHLKAPYDDFYRVWRQTADRRTTGAFRTLEENLEFICRELKLAATDEQLTGARRARFDYVRRALMPSQDAIEVLRQLKSDGCRTGLVSNCSWEPPIIWPETAFAPLIDAAVFSSTAGVKKPDPRIYRMAIEKLGIKPQDCLYIGDGDSHELEGAAGVGMNPVLIQSYEVNADIIKEMETDDWPCPRISSLTEVMDLVK